MISLFPLHHQKLTTLLASATLALFSFTASAQELPDPTRFEDDIRRFEADDIQSPPPADGIVLVGSSSIMFWNEDAIDDLAPLTVIPRGFGGSVMHDLLYYLDRTVLTYSPRAVLIYEGDNDTGRYHIPNDVIMEHVETGIDRIHESFPEARIYLLSVKPSIAREDYWPIAVSLNTQYQALAESDPRIHYIDVATPFMKADGTVRDDIFVEDNLHLNEKGYDIWAETIREVLMAHEAQYE